MGFDQSRGEAQRGPWQGQTGVENREKTSLDEVVGAELEDGAVGPVCDKAVTLDLSVDSVELLVPGAWSARRVK